MKIMMLPPYCYPEQVSSSHLIQDLYQAFSDAGIEVEVFAPTPCRGIDQETREKYRRIKTEKLLNGAVTIHRFPLYAEGKNPISRAFRYILCNLIQIDKGSKARDIDVLYSSSTPPTQGLMMGTVKKRLRKKLGYTIPYLYCLQDVFPDSLVSAGMASKGSLLWKLGRKIEDRTYRYADKIVVISEDIKRNILDKGVPEEKIEVIPNWIDSDEVHPVPRRENKLFDELGIDRDQFIVVYAGNLGKAQGIDTFIDAAKQVDDVQFLIFGDGSSREEVVERCAGCGNIHVFPLMPRSRVAEVYSMGNLSLVSCKKGLGAGAVPSKTFSIMATGTPVLLSFDGGTALWRMIEDERCGICAGAGDADALAEAIRWARVHADEVRQMGSRARACVERDYTKEVGTGRMLKVIRQMIEEATEDRP